MAGKRRDLPASPFFLPSKNGKVPFPYFVTLAAAALGRSVGRWAWAAFRFPWGGGVPLAAVPVRRSALAIVRRGRLWALPPLGRCRRLNNHLIVFGVPFFPLPLALGRLAMGRRWRLVCVTANAVTLPTEGNAPRPRTTKREEKPMITGLIPVGLLMVGIIGYIVFDCVKMGRNIKRIKRELAGRR